MMEDEALYIISVASRLLAMHPQTLRKYERAGFVAPSRTKGNLRLYSPEDIQRLRQVKYLVEDVGVTSLAGVNMALQVSAALRRLLYRAEARGDAERFRQEVEQTCRELLALLGAPEPGRRDGQVRGRAGEYEG
jgi:MerR family transcriptional regulator/heat shock protein HspR